MTNTENTKTPAERFADMMDLISRIEGLSEDIGEARSNRNLSAVGLAAMVDLRTKLRIRVRELGSSR